MFHSIIENLRRVRSCGIHAEQYTETSDQQTIGSYRSPPQRFSSVMNCVNGKY
ncbi:hypothetical protein PHET_12200 [Paragonimus heterotremus]|uniref:Uncharacterized protein n=1 Tax=Paragonimus heterotremus TaxID=100268 RepID=A0A8J4SRB1_9TREM|nr:hypothetical protein PHET_12200 [Paragonimus heterotremus]